MSDHNPRMAFPPRSWENEDSFLLRGFLLHDQIFGKKAILGLFSVFAQNFYRCSFSSEDRTIFKISCKYLTFAFFSPVSGSGRSLVENFSARQLNLYFAILEGVHHHQVQETSKGVRYQVIRVAAFRGSI